MVSPKADLTIVVLGADKIGKTSLIQSFLHGKFNEKYEPTVFEQYDAELLLDEGRKVKLEIWDTSG